MARLEIDGAVAKPSDVQCVPYTRDVRRFDPKTLDDERDSTRWSKVGTDFHAWAFYELVGILNVGKDYAAGQDVRYRVVSCETCGEMFDVYLSLKPGSRLSAIWPHLFGESPTTGIRVYNRVSLPLWVYRLGGSRPSPAGVLLTGALLLLVSNRWLALPFTEHVPRSASLLLHVVGVVTMLIVLALYDRIVQLQAGVADLAAVMKVSKLKWAVHWHNFTLSRFVGVQKESGPPRASQVDLVPGGLAVLLVIATWSVTGHNPLASVAAVLEATFLLGCSLAVVRSPIRRARKYVLVAAVALAPSTLVVVVGQLPFWSPELTRLAYEQSVLVFWSAFAYVFGVGYYLALSAVFYVLRGMNYLPLRIPFFAGLKDLGPFAWIRRFSIQMMLTVFVSSIVLVSLAEAFRQTQLLPPDQGWLSSTGFLWIEWWFLGTLGLIFGALAVTVSTVYLIAFVPFVIAELVLWITQASTVSILNDQIRLDLRVLVFGIFLITLFLIHALVIGRTVHVTLFRARSRVISLIDVQVALIEARLGRRLSGRRWFAETLTTRDISRLDSLNAVRSRLSAEGYPKTFPWAGGTLLTIASLVIPPVFDIVGQSLSSAP